MDESRLPEPAREALTKLRADGSVAGANESEPAGFVVSFVNGYHVRIHVPRPEGFWYDREATEWFVTQGAHALASENQSPKFPDLSVGSPQGHSSGEDIAQALETVAAYPPHVGAKLWGLTPAES